jgi:hypothetical protein
MRGAAAHYLLTLLAMPTAVLCCGSLDRSIDFRHSCHCCHCAHSSIGCVGRLRTATEDCLTAGAALLGAIGLTAPLCVRVRGRWSDVVDELLRLAAAPVRASDDGLLCDHRFHISVLSYQRRSLQTNRSRQRSAVRGHSGCSIAAASRESSLSHRTPRSFCR